MKTSGNTILVTGGTSGIGLGLAQRFHAAGNTVIIAGRRTDLLTQITAAHPGMSSIVLDVSDPESITACRRTVDSQHPDLNVLVNNAGIMLPEDLTDANHLQVAEQTVATNLLGPIRLTSALLPALRQRPGAVVMNVSSGLAFVPLPATPTYNATKAAIHSFTQSLRVQLGDSNVEVLELVPPAVRTDLMGQRDSEHAMPLEEFLDEVMALLDAHHDSNSTSGEICVERVGFLRNAEAEGRHAEVLAMMSGLAR